MAGNDNILGAPTEGLGQTVTFAFDTPGGLPAAVAEQSGRFNARVQGGGAANMGRTKATGVEVGDTPTLRALTTIAGNIIKPVMERKKQEAFFNGMQRAMQGEAVADIAAEQPWYSRLFGESDVVEGARAFATNTVAQTTLAAMEDKMPELRQMGQKEAQKYFNDAITSNLTGDRATDAGILQSFSRAMPAMMRRQVKEHYGWQQETALSNQTASIRAQADALQRTATGYASGYVTDEEFGQQRSQYVQSFMPVFGQDEEHYKKGMTQSLLSQAQAGNFHAITAARDSGFFDVLNEDQRLKVEKAVEAGESMLRTRYSHEWNDDLARILAQARGGTGSRASAEEIAKEIDGLNVRYSKTTGSKMGLISPEVRSSLVSGRAVDVTNELNRQTEKAYAEAQKVAAAGDKAAAKQMKDDAIRLRVAQGSGIAELLLTPDVSREDVERVALDEYRNLKPPAQARMLAGAFESNTVYNTIKATRVGQINAALQAGDQVMVPKFEEAFANYSQLRQAGGVELADAYYGKHAAALDGMYNDVKNGIAPQGSFSARFINPQRTRLGTKEMKEAVKEVTSEINSWVPEWMGGVPKLKPGQARKLVNLSTDLINQFADSSGDIKGAVKRAWKQQAINGVETLGGYVWDNNKQPSLAAYLTTKFPNVESRLGSDKISDAFADAVEHKLYGGDGKAGLLSDQASDVSVLRLADQGGVPTFHIQAIVDGKDYNTILSANEVFTQAAEKRKRSLASPASYDPTKGPPSPYAGPEVWAKYREYQASQRK